MISNTTNFMSYRSDEYTKAIQSGNSEYAKFLKSIFFKEHLGIWHDSVENNILDVIETLEFFTSYYQKLLGRKKLGENVDTGLHICSDSIKYFRSRLEELEKELDK